MVAFGNLCIVAQDWDFPNFSESKDLAIMSVQLSSFTIPIPDWLRIGAEKRLPVWSGMKVGSGLYISGKWFNYFGILWGVAFDWAYWFMTALCFRTCDYAQVNIAYCYTSIFGSEICASRSLYKFLLYSMYPLLFHMHCNPVCYAVLGVCYGANLFHDRLWHAAAPRRGRVGDGLPVVYGQPPD